MEVSEQRRLLREAFVASLGWGNVTMEALPADASFRRYYRLSGTPKPMLLMQDPPDRPPVPPYVMVEPFVKIADHLRSLGLHAPEIYARDMANGLLVLEDFGDDTYTRLLNRGVPAPELYELAVDVLAHLHLDGRRTALPLPAYDERLLNDEAMLLLDWYYPELAGKPPTGEMKEGFRAVWRGLFARFPKDQQTLVLRDYHVDNLMLVAGGQGLARCGLLDFQDAVIGPFSYDLMSLLEDARRDVPDTLRAQLRARYFAALEKGGAKLDRAAFDYSFRVLAAQRHAKVLGIFVRLFVRDGKDRYLQFIPHVHRLFLASLADPALKPLKDWFDANGFDVAKEPKFTPKK